MTAVGGERRNMSGEPYFSLGPREGFLVKLSRADQLKDQSPQRRP